MMLSGTYRHAIDPKYRLFIPAKFREEIGDVGETLIVTKNVDHCLNVYSKTEWAKFTEKLESLPDISGRKIRRFLFSSAHEVEVDKQGRILLPLPLREYAGLEKDTVIIGTGKNLEIWDEAAWEGLNPEDGMAEAMEALGI